jgi:hypothetical protein
MCDPTPACDTLMRLLLLTGFLGGTLSTYLGQCIGRWVNRRWPRD